MRARSAIVVTFLHLALLVPAHSIVMAYFYFSSSTFDTMFLYMYSIGAVFGPLYEVSISVPVDDPPV
jgi:hypothetical protein